MADESEHQPEWWESELEITPHLLKRMADRSFNEVELRSMLATPTGWRASASENRFIISSQHHGRMWEIVVEPDRASRLLTVITAYQKSIR